MQAKRNVYSTVAHLPYNPRIPNRRPLIAPQERITEGIRKTSRFPKAKMLLFVGLGFLIIVVAYTLIIPTFDNAMNQVQYGSGRISNFDFNVGHGGTSHFIAQAYHGNAVVIEIDPPNYKVTTYTFPIDPSYNGNVVSIAMQDVNHDGRSDLVISVEGDMVAMVLYNTGKGWQRAE